jgi:hypothetical protein
MRVLSFCLVVCVLVGAADGQLEKPPVLEGFTLEHNIGENNLPVDGKTTETAGWVESDFDGKGEVKVENGTVTLGKGNDMTGIRWTGPVAKMNYEISLEAKRVDGSDFFCGLTFPYGDNPCSFIAGGWGGTVVGISSLDFQDAYNNETCKFKKFENNKWYAIRVKITPNYIQAWIDDEQFVKVKTTGREIGIRSEVEKSRPLGVATWRTTAAIRNVNLNVYTKPPEEPKDADE